MWLMLQETAGITVFLKWCSWNFRALACLFVVHFQVCDGYIHCIIWYQHAFWCNPWNGMIEDWWTLSIWYLITLRCRQWWKFADGDSSGRIHWKDVDKWNMQELEGNVYHYFWGNSGWRQNEGCTSNYVFSLKAPIKQDVATENNTCAISVHRSILIGTVLSAFPKSLQRLQLVSTPIHGAVAKPFSLFCRHMRWKTPRMPKRMPLSMPCPRGGNVPVWEWQWCGLFFHDCVDFDPFEIPLSRQSCTLADQVDHHSRATWHWKNPHICDLAA